MAEETNLVLDAAQRIFQDLADPQFILKCGTQDWRTPLWQALDEMGLPHAWLPESLGGHGLSLADGFAVVHAAGRSALAVPLVETMIAGWIAGQAGLPLGAGAATVILAGSLAHVELDAAGHLRVQARGVPFAREVQSIVVVAGDPGACRVAVVPAGDCRISAGLNLADDASDSVQIDTKAQTWAKAPALSVDRALYLAATCRALQIAGALQAALDMSVAWAKERVAFEKPIAKFQAVQHNLARLAGEVAAADASSQSAAATVADVDVPADECLLEVASAKVRCGEAAETGAAIAHQVLGAIGFTQEHILHRFTLRMLSWRDDFGSEATWAKRLGEAVARGGSGAELWRLLSTR